MTACGQKEVVSKVLVVVVHGRRWGGGRWLGRGQMVPRIEPSWSPLEGVTGQWQAHLTAPYFQIASFLISTNRQELSQSQGQHCTTSSDRFPLSYLPPMKSKWKRKVINTILMICLVDSEQKSLWGSSSGNTREHTWKKNCIVPHMYTFWNIYVRKSIRGNF